MPDKKNKGASEKKTKPKLVITPVECKEEETKGNTRSIGIGMPVDEETLREMKENARKL
jgi:hypothetical protein